MADYLYGFKGVNEIGKYQTTEQIENNLALWLNWGALSIGTFNTVTSGRLRPLDDPRYNSGQVWQGLRSDWIWETGIPYAIQPVHISGIYLNSSFIGTGHTGTNSYKIDYPNGLVIFNTGIPVTSIIKVNHSYRAVQVRRSDEPFFQNLLYNSFNEEDVQFTGLPLTSGGGQWGTLPEHKVQLPVYVIDPLTDIFIKPAEIGNSSRNHRQFFQIHVLSETPWERKRLHDILVNQYNKRICTIDFNTAPLPLNYDNTLNSGAMTYPQMWSGYPWKTIWIANVTSNDNGNIGKKLFWSTIKYAIETDIA